MFDLTIDVFRRNAQQFLSASPALLTVLSFATHIGWTSPALPEFLHNTHNIVLTPDESSWFASIISLGCILGLTFTILTGTWWGRKTTVAITAVPLLLGWILIIVARHVYVLYAARLIAGFGWGMSATIVPVFTGEIATDGLRGALTSTFQIMLATGPIIEYALVPTTNAITAAIISAAIPVLVLVLVTWMPESPYYLVMTGQDSKAKETLVKLRASKDIDGEFAEIKKTVAYQTVHPGTLKELLTHENHLRGMGIMLGMLTIQAWCGTVVVLIYAHTIFKDINWDAVPPNVLAFILITLPCVSSVISSMFVDVVGKKPFLIVSTFGCFVSMFIVGVFFHARESRMDVSGWFTTLAACSLIFFKFIHGLGIAGIPFIQLSELFSSNIKILAVALSKGYLFILHFAANRAYQVIADELGVYVPFYIFAGVSLAGMVFIVFCVPETKGDSLHDIQVKLGARYSEAGVKREPQQLEMGKV